MYNPEITLPKSFSRHTIELCSTRNINSLEELIYLLKIGKRIKQITWSSEKSYSEIINALPAKIQKDYLNRSIVISKALNIDYALSRKDEEIFFQNYIDRSLRYFCLQNNISTYKKFISFLKSENRITSLKGATKSTETDMMALMPEHIRGWYLRFHTLRTKESFSSISPEIDTINHHLLDQLSVRSKNLAITYGLYNLHHFQLVISQNINLEKYHGIGKKVTLEFHDLVEKNNL